MTDERPWLVRTAANLLTGPMAREQVVGWIQDGRLGAHDEVCAGGGYWFYLSEGEEVRSQLGIEPPPELSSAAYVQDEITQTQTETDLGSEAGERDYPELSEIPASADERSIGTRRTKSRVVPVGGASAPAVAASASATSVKSPPRARQIESTSVWKGIAWALIVLVGVLLIAVFRALQR